MVIRTYAYGYTHIRVWLYAHTRIGIRTYAYGYTHIRVYLYAYISVYISVWCLFVIQDENFSLCFIVVKKKELLSVKRDEPTTEELTYCSKLMQIMLQTRTLHRFEFMYLLSNEKKRYICFVFCCWWIRRKRKMLHRSCFLQANFD